MAYLHKWSPISYRTSVGQGKFAGQRPAIYHCATQLLTKRRQHLKECKGPRRQSFCES